MSELVIAWNDGEGEISGLGISETEVRHLGRLIHSELLAEILAGDDTRVAVMTVESESESERQGLLGQDVRIRGFIRMNVDRPDDVDPSDPSPGYLVAKAIEKDFERFYREFSYLWEDRPLPSEIN